MPGMNHPEQAPVTPQQNIQSELSTLSVRDLFYKYVRYFPLFVVSAAISLMAAYVYLRYAEESYTATAVLSIKAEGAGGSRGDKFDELFDNSSVNNVQTEMEVLKSPPILRRVVERYGLSISYYGVGKIKTVNVYNKAPFKIVPIHINDSTAAFSLNLQTIDNNQVRVEGVSDAIRYGQTFTTSKGTFQLVQNLNNVGGNLYRVDWTPPSIVAKQLASELKVAPRVANTGILNLTIELPNPELCLDVLNGLMHVYADYNVEQKKLSSEQILNFAEDRLSDIGRRLDSVQNVYLDYQIRYNIIDPQSQIGAYATQVTDAEKLLSEQSIQSGLVSMLDGYLADKKNEFSKIVVPSSMGISDPVLNGLVSTYNQLQLQRQLLIDGNVPVQNPGVRELDGQLEKVRLSIRENLSNIRQANDKLVASVRTRGQQGQSKLNDLPLRIKELAEIKRQVETYQALYKLFIEKKEETAISRASTISGVEILEQAPVSSIPVSPNRRSIQLMAFLIGLAIPALFIFGAELLNDKIQSRFDIQKYTQAPILGEVGHSFAEHALVVNRNSRSVIAEQFRIVRTSLQYFLQKKEKATILVTSTFSGEGKSFASTNIAAVQALAGKKTILLEFDIRKPKVLSGLEMDKGQGIVNYLVGNTDDPAAVIRPVPQIENLFVMGCGPIPPNPSEILLEPRMDELFAYLKSNFDVVVIDTAPVGMVSDGITLGKYADCTVYMVRQNYSFKKQLVLINDYYEQKRLPHLSLLLNDVKSQGGYGSYGYGRYGYRYGYGNSYGYGSYFEEDKKPKSRLNSISTWWKGLWG